MGMVAFVVWGVGGGADLYRFGKRGLRAIQNAITEIIAFGEMAKIFDF
jgi:hypothetical protein